MNRAVKMCAVLITCISINGFAGESCFQKGNNLAQAGIGLGMGSGFPAGLVLTYEHAILDLVSIGGSFAFSGKKDENLFYEASWKSIPILVRGNFHPFNLPALDGKVGIKDKLDVYGGLAMGFAIRKAKVSYKFSEFYGPNQISENDNTFLFSFILGARYYFTNNIGVYLEESAVSTGVFNLGAVFKF